MSGIVIGARTGSEGGGGSYSVFYNAVPRNFGEAFSREAAWVDGLQQNQENRSNGTGPWLLVNTGEVDDHGEREKVRLPSGDLQRGDGMGCWPRRW